RLADRLYQCDGTVEKENGECGYLPRHQAQRSLPRVPGYQDLTMLVYNITIKIEQSIAAAWLKWQQEEHIPGIMASGCFTHHLFYRLTEPVEPGEITY